MTYNHGILAKDNGNVLNNRKREFQELVFAGENTLELRFKEKNVEMDVEAGSTFSKSNVRLGTGGDRYISVFLPKFQLNTYSFSVCSGYLQHPDRQNMILSELYDSLDKKSPPSKMDLDSLDVNLNNEEHYSSDTELNKNVFDSLEVNVWNKGVCLNKNTALQVENVLKKKMHCQTETDEVFVKKY